MAWTSTTVPCTGFDITVYLPRPSAHHVTNTKPNSRVSSILKSTVFNRVYRNKLSVKIACKNWKLSTRRRIPFCGSAWTVDCWWRDGRTVFHIKVAGGNKSHISLPAHLVRQSTKHMMISRCVTQTGEQETHRQYQDRKYTGNTRRGN